MSTPRVSTPSGTSYWEETRRPVYSAALVLPFLLIYELGMLAYHPTYINGGDAMIKRMLGVFSVHAWFLSSLVLLVCFAVWQFRSKASWKIEGSKLPLLFLESLFYAVLLFLLMRMGLEKARGSALLPAAAGGGGGGGGGGLRGSLLELVLYCGAGVYEELVFRVLLLGLLLLAFTRLLRMDKAYATAWAVVLGAVLFSLFHYVGGIESFTWNSFFQRAFAGVYFSALFVLRSFGLAAAAHALYDILVGFMG